MIETYEIGDRDRQLAAEVELVHTRLREARMDPERPLVHGFTATVVGTHWPQEGTSLERLDNGTTILGYHLVDATVIPADGVLAHDGWLASGHASSLLKTLGLVEELSFSLEITAPSPTPAVSFFFRVVQEGRQTGLQLHQATGSRFVTDTHYDHDSTGAQISGAKDRALQKEFLRIMRLVAPYAGIADVLDAARPLRRFVDREAQTFCRSQGQELILNPRGFASIYKPLTYKTDFENLHILAATLEAAAAQDTEELQTHGRWQRIVRALSALRKRR